MATEEMGVAIKHERSVELAFEGLYYFDLMRWGPSDIQAAQERVVNVPGMPATLIPGSCCGRYLTQSLM